MENNKLIDDMLDTVQHILYQDSKYSEKEMAEMIIKLLEKAYDI